MAKNFPNLSKNRTLKQEALIHPKCNEQKTSKQPRGKTEHLRRASVTLRNDTAEHRRPAPPWGEYCSPGSLPSIKRPFNSVHSLKHCRIQTEKVYHQQMLIKRNFKGYNFVFPIGKVNKVLVKHLGDYK